MSSFIESVAILLLTAGITGLAVPFIKGRMDLRYFCEQKNTKAELHGSQS
jgi:hypothetical protein